MFMLGLVGDAELRRGSSLYAAITGMAKIAGPGLSGLIIAASGEAAVFLIDGASFLLVIGVLVWQMSRMRDPVWSAQESTGMARRVRWGLLLPVGIRGADAMGPLIGRRR